MGTTSNYSWPTPEQTDLVKNGWDAIKDLGDAADTTVKAVADAQGLVHIDTVSIGSGVSAVNVDNVFTSTYTNYRIIANIVASNNTNSGVLMRMRAAGTDASGSNYDRNLFAMSTATTYTRATDQTSWIAGPTSTTSNGMSLDIYNPQKSLGTSFLGLTYYNANSEMDINGGIHQLTTAYDGFTFLTSAGTFTSGEIKVFGYKD